MTERDMLSGRLKDLSGRAYRNDYLTHTDFLGVSEQADFHAILASQGVQPSVHRLNGAPYVLWGGWEEAERCAAVFLPSYLDEDSFIEGELTAPQVVACLSCRPLDSRFADDLTHRDFLGALMNLGIERDQIGDILVDREAAQAAIFVLADLAETVARELTRVKHTSVTCFLIPPGECAIRPEFELREGSVASERVDAVISLVFRLARGKTQAYIDAERVFADGRAVTSAGQVLKPGTRVSVRGLGKFVYEGCVTETKKGRLFVRVRVYK